MRLIAFRCLLHAKSGKTLIYEKFKELRIWQNIAVRCFQPGVQDDINKLITEVNDEQKILMGFRNKLSR